MAFGTCPMNDDGQNGCYCDCLMNVYVLMNVGARYYVLMNVGARYYALMNVCARYYVLMNVGD